MPIRQQRKLTEHEYHKHRPRKVPIFEHVYSVQICQVFVGLVTYDNELGRELQHIRQFVKLMLIKEESHVSRQSCEQPSKK